MDLPYRLTLANDLTLVFISNHLITRYESACANR
jgi:hypothetical protein